ncbi:hypothetical protein BC834DRAFT_227074 [Gloeopeniophorella convolvens]|nr:hypothetical protein BC834DRAFT_227074 [Gloeopeniophorella convolvens]
MTELLSQCISILQSIASEDCLFPLSPPRPSRPPNSLQAIVLDVGLLLLHMHAKSPVIISQVGFALLPAFATFKSEMRPRLIGFFEGVLRIMLPESRRLQGLTNADRYPFNNEEPSIDDAMQHPPVSIQVETYDEAQAGFRTDSQRSQSSTYTDRCTTSSSSPGQTLTSYRLNSLVSPLLAAISDALDLTDESTFTLYRLRRLIDMIVQLKPDAASSILEVVAYHTSRARYTALGILSSYWHRSIGHCFIAKPIKLLGSVKARGSPPSAIPQITPPDRRHAHEFVLWRFEKHPGPSLFDGQILQECRSCSKQIIGLGLFCPLCVCAIHFDCYDYPDGNLIVQYPAEPDSTGTQKVAVYRFCHLQGSKDSLTGSVIPSVSGHTFRAVNTFTLTLCSFCKLPLWGCHGQGLKCDNCNHFAHARCAAQSTEEVARPCLSSPLTSAHTTISLLDLRQSFEGHFKDLFQLDQDSRRSYEEAMICYDILWAQSQILANGFALGTVIPEEGDEALKPFNLELRSLLDRFERIILSQTISPSDVLNDFYQECRLPRKTTLLFNWTTLTFISSSLRLANDESDTLAVDAGNYLEAHSQRISEGVEAPTRCFETMPLGLLRDILKIDFRLGLDTTAAALLDQLHRVGLFEILDTNTDGTENLLQRSESLCSFPLPLGLDLSVNVETLLTAIEACLSDIDLSVNETGLLLLIRRVWPTELATEYTLRRLMTSVLRWILAEDEKLAIILRDYIPFGRDLPGVRPGSVHHHWPDPGKTPTSNSSANNGGDYLAQRRALLKNYVYPWLLALHDQDITFYGQTCFDITVEIAEEMTGVEMPEEMIDMCLRHIIRLCQAFVVFTTFDDLFLLWLESTSGKSSNRPISSLQRLLNREASMNQRLSSFIDTRVSLADASSITAIDPWSMVIRIASADRDGLCRSLQWLCVFARSAVDVPGSVFQRFESLADRFKLSTAETYPLVQAALLSVWLKSLGRQELQNVMSSIHLRLSSEISKLLSQGNVSTIISDFIRLSLATCLLVAGCPRGILTDHALVTENEILQLPSRRTVHARASMMADPIHMDIAFVQALGDYVEARREAISVIIAKFFHLFVTQCSLLEVYEVDNFILRNAGVLSTCAWSFYDLQSRQLSSICPNLLTRIIVVDSQPLEGYLQSSLHHSADWEARLRTLRQLFRITLDVINPSFIIEDRQWQSSATAIFCSYFSAQWQDPQEEIRGAVDTWSQTLLPAHFEALSDCWSKALARAPMSERVKLVTFLIKLHSLFPHWRVLSWDVILKVLSEGDDIPSRDSRVDPAPARTSTFDDVPENETQVHPIAADPDVVSLHTSTLLLGLKMISSGIEVDLLTLVMLKKRLVQLLGFDNVTSVPIAPAHAPHVAFDYTRTTTSDVSTCLDELLPVLDAPHPYSLDVSSMTGSLPTNDTPAPLLVGSIFVDVPLAFVNVSQDFLALPFLTTKRLIECMLVIMYKHDMESQPLRHLQGILRRAVRQMLTVALAEVSYELRQLALTVAQTYIKLWPNMAGSFVLESIETSSQIVTSLGSNKDDLFASQAASFIDGSLLMFAENGITIALFKRPHVDTFFTVLQSCTDNKPRNSLGSQGLRDALLRDTVSRMVESDTDSFKLVMQNLNHFVENVHNEAYDPGLLRHFGLCLTNVVRRTAEWSPDTFDPSPLLLIISTLIANNQGQARDFLVHVDTILRAVLIRFHISQASFVRLLDIGKGFHLRLKKQVTSVDRRLEQNRIISTILEIIGDALRRKSRVFPSTLTAMIEAIIQTSVGAADYEKDLDSSLAKLGADGVSYLQSHTQQGGNAEIEVNTSLAAAKLVLHGSEFDVELIPQLLSEQSVERSSRQLNVHTWNILLLAALLHENARPGALITAYFPSFVSTYREALASSSSMVQGIVSAAANINHCYASVKLWLLLERMLSQPQEPQEGVVPAATAGPFIIWNELWPPFANLITVHDVDTPKGQNTPLWSATSSVIADLFHFLGEFHSSLTLETAVHEAILNRLRVSGPPDGPNSKLVRTLRDIHEPVPKASWTTLLDQVKKDILAAEKLEMLEARDLSKATNQDKHRRESRAI